MTMVRIMMLYDYSLVLPETEGSKNLSSILAHLAQGYVFCRRVADGQMQNRALRPA